MFRVFGDIPHCLNQRHDIILLGEKDEVEHRKTLRTVLQRAKDYGITFNKKKCKFEQEELNRILWPHLKRKLTLYSPDFPH